MSDSKEPVLFEEDPSLFWAPSTLKKVALTWLIPGYGYFLQGRRRAGILMACCLYGAFFMGLLQGGDLFPFSGEGKLRAIGAVCQMGMGLPYLLTKLMMGLEWIHRGSPLSVGYDYGTSYFLIAGMLAWLSVLDIFDISVKRK